MSSSSLHTKADAQTDVHVEDTTASPDAKTMILSVDKSAHNSDTATIVGLESGRSASIDSEDPQSFDYVKVKLSNFEFTLVYIGLLLAILLYAIDQTIVTTANNAIGQEFQALEQISWVGSSYLLTTAAFAPLYGKLADTFGRKSVLLFAIVVFEIGSAICGAAVSMNMLIIGRAIAGVGGGGIYSLVFITISDIVSMRKRAAFQGFFGAVFGVSSVFGPLLGGAFTDHISWRWCFYINLPIGFVAIAAVVAFLKFQNPEGSIWNKLKRIDFLGTLLIAAAIACLVVPLQNGGSVWEWSDWRTIVMFVASVVIMVVFVMVERYVAVEPIVPASVFESISVIMMLVIATLIGASFFGLLFYFPLYFQLVNGDTATQAGFETMPLVLGVTFVSILSGLMISRYGYFTPWLYGGSVLLTIGVGLSSALTHHSTRVMQAICLLLVGISVGAMIQTRLTGLQASVSQHNIAIATSLSNLCQTLGGTLGIAIIGAIFNNVFANCLGRDLVKQITENPASVWALPPNETERVLQGFSDAFSIAYKAVIPMAALILVFTAFVKQERMSSGDRQKEHRLTISFE